MKFVPWAEAGLEDHEMVWKDEYLEEMVRARVVPDIDDSKAIMLSDLWEVTDINLSGLNFPYDLSSLSELKNLTWLRVESFQNKDLNWLSDLTNLQELYLPNYSYSDIEDISGLFGLKNLQSLTLKNAIISAISAPCQRLRI